MLHAGKTKLQIHSAVRETFNVEWRQCDRDLSWLTRSRTLRDSDRMEIARYCQATGIAIKELDRRDASDHRARKVNRLFRALRQKGWSLDRVAKATGYSTRGVASNLERFTQSAIQETGRADDQKTQNQPKP